MQLHHELQRALADTKIGQASATPRPQTRTDAQSHRDHTAGDARRVRFLLRQRLAVRDGR